ncbi:MAG: binding-protein-dependent transport system inner rane component [Nocardioides sp.]|jgi:ABC-type nitrate/sulfonate/bicarbonate transport system permease component|uniref:ABC transporter permease n=1 Tax=Nocardioides sp. TaxID=35761 RepID=UPI00261918ED|nr:ABC transporter permease [Nocardioides sp.]MCW2835039.1 binding-protein-dependent transport system inner rane component [Nocardioides sp.]
MRNTFVLRWGQGLIGLAALIAVLELLPRTSLVSARYLPPFSTMMTALRRQLGEASFWSALLNTAQAWAIGLTIAMILGIVLGLVIGSFPLLRELTFSTIEFLRPIPSVALIPLVVLMFGTRMQGTLVLVVYASLWQVLIQVLYGVQDVDPVVRETARSYRFGRMAQVRHVVWPTALPFVMTGFRLAATVALVLTITAELVIGSPGIGKQIAVAQSSGAVATMYSLVIVTGALGVLVNLLARALERRVLAWHPSHRSEVIA